VFTSLLDGRDNGRLLLVGGVFMDLKDYEMEIICMHDGLRPDESNGTLVAPMSTDGRSDGYHHESRGSCRSDVSSDRRLFNPNSNSQQY
jgi:hypothetical protein